MKNPFEEQSEMWKKEAQKWSNTSKVVGVIFIIILFLALYC